MSTLQNSELRRIETKYPEGISSAAVVKIFQQKGERFSEATLRKYVQLGLLPTSRRVGIRGRHRGSSGLYPCIIVRLANDIKKALEAGQTLEDIRTGTTGLLGEIELLRRAADQTFERVTEAVVKRHAKKPAVKKQLTALKKSLEKEIRNLADFVEKLDAKPKR